MTSSQGHKQNSEIPIGHEKPTLLHEHLVDQEWLNALLGSSLD